MKKTLVEIYIYLFVAVIGLGFTIFILKMLHRPYPELLAQITGTLVMALFVMAYAQVVEYLIKNIFQSRSPRCFLINPGEKFAKENIFCSIFWKNKPYYVIRHFKVGQPQHSLVYWNCCEINADEFYLAVLVMPIKKERLVFNIIWDKDMRLMAYWTAEAKCKGLCIFKIPGFYLEKTAIKPVFIYQTEQNTFKKTMEYLRIETKMQYNIIKFKNF